MGRVELLHEGIPRQQRRQMVLLVFVVQIPVCNVVTIRNSYCTIVVANVTGLNRSIGRRQFVAALLSSPAQQGSVRPERRHNLGD